MLKPMFNIKATMAADGSNFQLVLISKILWVPVELFWLKASENLDQLFPDKLFTK